MAIKFNCPHCKKVLTVKDHMAGKRGPCPECKQILTVPAAPSAAKSAGQTAPKPPTKPGTKAVPKAAPFAAPPPPPDVDLEALAASALKDEPPPEAPKETESKTIDFTCPFCDAALHLNAELEGKQAPCPECRRIIKVPKLVKAGPLDWRKADGGLPSGARRDTQPVPEGAWVPTSTVVSADSLAEAGALPQEQERTTLKQWIIRGMSAAAVLGLLIGGLLWAFSLRRTAQENDSFKKAMNRVSADGKQPKLGPERDGLVHRGAGEYYLRLNQKDSAQQARTHFQIARSLLASAPDPNKDTPNVDRDSLLIDLALAQIDQGGSEDEVNRGTRLKWADAVKDARETLSRIRISEQHPRRTVSPRVDGLQAVVRKLLEKDQAALALVLIQDLQGQASGVPLPAEVPEATAVAGLELLRAGQNDKAERCAALAWSLYDPANQSGNSPLVVAPSLLALWVKLGKKGGPLDLLKEPESQTAKGDAVLPWVVARAQEGNFDSARKHVQQITNEPEARLQAQLAVAAAGLSADPPQTNDLAPAFDLVEEELRKGARLSPWLLVRLAQLAPRAGLSDRLAKLTSGDSIKDEALRARMQLELLRERLKPGSKLDTELLDLVDAKTVSGAVARDEIARQAGRQGGEGSLSPEIKDWPEDLQAFGYIGLTLGLQDRK